MEQIYVVSSAKHTYTENGCHTTPFPPMTFAKKEAALAYIKAEIEMEKTTINTKFESESGRLTSFETSNEDYSWTYELWTSEIL